MRTTVRWIVVGIVLVLALAAPAASRADRPGPAPDEVAFGAVAGSRLTDVAPAQPLPAGMAEDEAAAVAAVDGYWRRNFAELSGKPYRSPRVAGGYLGRNGPACAGSPPIPFNAFYCKPGDFLAWDENLMAFGYRRIGDPWVYLVIAHEWGHAIQARVRRGLTIKQVELQADCLAGAALQGAVQERLVTIEPGDDQKLANALAAAADETPWTNQRDHGNAQERISAFNTGTRGGAKSCF